MSRIERLDQETVEQIAAGELITRPARVVGELLDNALDAGATRIRVEIAGDGTDEIVVADDGRGLSAADVSRAFRPHTTSKLTDAEDLQTVQTLGFRGEGLASIVDAAREVTVTTRAVDATAGTRVTVGPDGEETTTASRDVGTTVAVRGLFADRPARAESLATPAGEFRRISALVARYALCRPEVGLRLTHDGRETLSTPGTGSTAALLAVYDRETASRVTTLDRTDGSIRLTADLVHPSITRSDRHHVRCGINGRPVTNDTLRRAVTDGYDRLLAGDEWPIAVVRLQLPPARVDPNVHPAKRRVAVADADRLAETLTTAVRETLRTADLAAADAVETEPLDPPAEQDARLGEATYLGQYRELYLLCEAETDLLVVDQHAAHERVTFERLQAALADESVPSRSVDPPATVSTDPTTAATIREVGDQLRAAGFEFEPFGGSDFRVRAVPAPLGRTLDPEALGDTAVEFESSSASLADDGLAELACHPSLRAGDTLEESDARELLEQLAGCRQPYACPHGRPTVVRIEEATLARGFDRPNTRL